MTIELKKGADGNFIRTPQNVFTITDEDIRDLGEHQNTPLSERTIFEASNRGHRAKPENKRL